MSSEIEGLGEQLGQRKSQKETFIRVVNREWQGQEIPPEAVSFLADTGSDLVLSLGLLQVNENDEQARTKAVGAFWALNALGQQGVIDAAKGFVQRRQSHQKKHQKRQR